MANNMLPLKNNKYKNMKLLRLLLPFLSLGIILTACQKDYSAESGTAKGNIVKDAAGDCMPITVNGAFVKDVVLAAGTNYADVQVNIIQLGTYNIKSDTVNGYFFSATGYAAIEGLTTVRLIAIGKPIAAGPDLLTLKFDGSTCIISNTVTATGGGGGGGTAATFTLGNTAGACTGAVLAGAYVSSIPTTSANTATINLTVNTVGTYNISTTSASDNGVTFRLIGTFLATGATSVQLVATGTPLAVGTFTYSLNGINNCTFTVTYVAPSPANFTFPGGPSACTVATVNGSYIVGTALTSTNTISVQVDVQSTGTYTISTSSANGISFTKTGFFSSTGLQNVVLAGSGTPAAGGANTMTILGTGGCTFSVTSVGPASYTLSGAPGVCTIATVNGTYRLSTVLTNSNTVDVQVNVTGTGAYTITTNTVGNISFSKSGIFTTLGLQTITLAGSGTPSILGSNIFTVGTGGCTFPVNVLAATSPCPGLVSGDFTVVGRFTISGIEYGLDLGSQYQISIQSGFIQMDMIFSTANRPTTGIYNVGSSLQISCPDQNFLSNFTTWDATIGQVYVNVDALTNEFTVEFCNVSFKGTTALGGTVGTAIGKGKVTL
jgi:hypothetical protein